MPVKLDFVSVLNTLPQSTLGALLYFIETLQSATKLMKLQSRMAPIMIKTPCNRPCVVTICILHTEFISIVFPSY